MFKSTVIFTFVVCSFAATASPSVSPAQHATGRGRGPGCSDSAGPTTEPTNNLTTPTQTMKGDCMSSTLVVKLITEQQQTIQLQALTIQGLLQIIKNPTTPIPTPNCTSEDAAICSLHKITLEMTNTIERLNNAIEELTNTLQMMNTARLTPTTTPAPTDCGHDSGYKYSNETGSCYKYHGEGEYWTQANDTCVAEKAHLAVINGRGEARLLGDMVKENGWPVHVGYHRDDAGEWRAVTGESVEAAAGYNPWADGYPVSEEQRRYAVVGRGDGAFIDMDNEYLLPFICEKRPQ